MENINWKSLTSDDFNDLVKSENDAFAFARLIGLIDEFNKCECGISMKICEYSRYKYGHLFKCTAGDKICRKTKSILSNTWFSKCKIGIRKALLCIRAYANESKTNQFAFDTGIVSKNSIVKWKLHFRQICFEICCSERRLIGGEGLTVQIDESLLFKRKYNVGRLSARQIEHDWIFGGICVENGDCFVVSVPNRNIQTLTNAVIENIAPGTKIISDSWRGYNQISSNGFEHARVNHSINFIDPTDESVNTQKIERMWRTIKSIIPNGTHSDIRWTYLAEFSFKQQNNWFNITIGQRIQLILSKLKLIKFN